jgi:hypothetical protein
MTRRGSLAVLLTALALSASAGPALASTRYARLMAPAAGEELTAGSLATVAWEELALPPHTEEWEAFLSVDGGRTYPLRVTPHLDIGIRRFSFRVPDLPTREARLMLRFGDERREVGFEAPQRFAIVPGPRHWAPPPRRVLSPGEAARKGGRGVALWVEGSRDGAGLREVAAVGDSPALTRVEPARSLALPLLWPAPDRASLPLPAASRDDPPPHPRTRVPGEGPRRSSPVAVRLLIHRFNE